MTSYSSSSSSSSSMRYQLAKVHINTSPKIPGLSSKTFQNIPITLDKKSIYIGEKGNWNMTFKAMTIMSLEEIQYRIQTLLDNNNEFEQRQQQPPSLYKNDYHEDEYFKLVFQAKKVYSCYFDLPRGRGGVPTISIQLMKFMKQLLKIVQKRLDKSSTMSKGTRRNKSGGSNNRYGAHDGLSSFGRVSNHNYSSSTSSAMMRVHKKSNSVQKKEKTIKSYSSKNTRLNIMKTKAFQRDMDHLYKDEEEDYDVHDDGGYDYDHDVVKKGNEDEPGLLEYEDEYNQNLDNNDDDEFDNDGKTLSTSKRVSSTKRKYLENNYTNKGANRKMKLSRVGGRRRLMKKTNHTTLNDDPNDYLMDSDDDAKDIDGFSDHDVENGSKNDDENNIITTTAAAAVDTMSIAAVSPTQLQRSMGNDNSDETEIAGNHNDTTVTDDDEGATTGENTKNSEDKNATNHEEEGNISNFFLKASASRQKKRREHRGKMYNSSADRVLGLSSGSVPKPSINKTPPRKNQLSKIPSTTSPPTLTNSGVKNPYKKENNSLLKKTKVNNSSTHIGLRNLGNTCYINASLQMLFSLPNFIKSLQQTYDEIMKKLDNTTTASGDNDDKSNPMPITRAFLKVAWDAKVIKTADGVKNPENVRSVDPCELKEAVDHITDKFAGYEQRDSHEFVSALIDYIHEELVQMMVEGDEGTSANDTVLPTDDYFKLNVKVCLTCDSCKYKRCKEELYRHLSIDVGQSKGDQEQQCTIDKSLDQFFDPEVRDIRCEKCNFDTATQTIEVLSRPKAILLHLKRFIISDKCIQKNTGRIEYDKTLSLRRFCEESITSNKDLTVDYSLCGMVRHIGGTASSGHYTAHGERMKHNTKGGDEKEWVSFDDGMTMVTKLSNVVENERNQRSAYMMLYEL